MQNGQLDVGEAANEPLNLFSVSTVCAHNWKEWEDENCNAQMKCTKCNEVKQTDY